MISGVGFHMKQVLRSRLILTVTGLGLKISWKLLKTNNVLTDFIVVGPQPTQAGHANRI